MLSTTFGGAITLWAEKRDGTPVLTGTASVGPHDVGGEPSEIEQRIAKLVRRAQS